MHRSVTQIQPGPDFAVGQLPWVCLEYSPPLYGVLGGNTTIVRKYSTKQPIADDTNVW